MSTIADEMAAYAQEAMKLTRKFFVVELDYSTASIERLDKLFDDVDFCFRGGRSMENIELLTRVWGSYFGEVICRNAGGQWCKTKGQAGFAGVTVNEDVMFPHDMVADRLSEPSQKSLNGWLQSLIQS